MTYSSYATQPPSHNCQRLSFGLLRDFKELLSVFKIVRKFAGGSRLIEEHRRSAALRQVTHFPNRRQRIPDACRWRTGRSGAMPVCIPYSGFPLCAAVGVEVDDLG